MYNYSNTADNNILSDNLLCLFSAPTNPGIVDPDFGNGAKSTSHECWFWQWIIALVMYMFKRTVDLT